MCDGYTDGRCDVWDGRWVKARKARPCMACEETIEPGMVYHRLDSLFDGQWDRWHHCSRCWITYSAIVDRNRREGHYDLYVSPWLNCGQVWQEPPKDIEAFAFMLPHEISAIGEKAYDRQRSRARA